MRRKDRFFKTAGSFLYFLFCKEYIFLLKIPSKHPFENQWSGYNHCPSRGKSMIIWTEFPWLAYIHGLNSIPWFKGHLCIKMLCIINNYNKTEILWNYAIHWGKKHFNIPTVQPLNSNFWAISFKCLISYKDNICDNYWLNVQVHLYIIVRCLGWVMTKLKTTISTFI